MAAWFSIARIGEFSFVLAQSGLDYELISMNYYQIFLAVSILLMSITPFVVGNAEDIQPALLRIVSKKQSKEAVDNE